MKRMIFLNIGWMRAYRGLKDDSIENGGTYVDENKTGDEIYNFLPLGRYCYGDVSRSIKLERLGGSPKDTHVDNVLVVWVAKRPNFGTVIVGWYRNATVYKETQKLSKIPSRKWKGKYYTGYLVKAPKKDCILILPKEARDFKVPHGKGWMGQSNVWYADKPRHVKFKKRVLNYIKKAQYRIKHDWARPPKPPKQLDPYRRREIEERAINMSWSYYKKLGYEVASVEKEKCGWDLEATKNGETLRLEVKGLSQEEICFELTRNEYTVMIDHNDTYRICVVTNALSKHPLLRIFSYYPNHKSWIADDGKRLHIKKVNRPVYNCICN
ncbi:MAG: DUF3883 domain-containing protein [candidate division WOR-3 bacterium]